MVWGLHISVQNKGGNMNDGQIASRLCKIALDVKAIGKDRTNDQQRFQFRGIDTVMNHLHPLFSKYSVVILPEVLDDRTEERQSRNGGNLIYRILKIKYHFVADDGSELCCVVIGEGMDSGDKAANKAMAVALKYALSQTLLLPYDEVDPDAETHPESTPKKPNRTAVPPPDPKAATKTEPLENKKEDFFAQGTAPANDKTDSPNYKFLETMKAQKKRIGDKMYYEILGLHGYEKSSEITSRSVQKSVYQQMKNSQPVEQKKEKEGAE
jgi:hypothetical protein